MSGFFCVRPPPLICTSPKWILCSLAESQVASSWREGTGAKGLFFQLINEHNARLIRYINWGMQ